MDRHASLSPAPPASTTAMVFPSCRFMSPTSLYSDTQDRYADCAVAPSAPGSIAARITYEAIVDAHATRGAPAGCTFKFGEHGEAILINHITRRAMLVEALSTIFAKEEGDVLRAVQGKLLADAPPPGDDGTALRSTTLLPRDCHAMRNETLPKRSAAPSASSSPSPHPDRMPPTRSPPQAITTTHANNRACTSKALPSTGVQPPWVLPVTLPPVSRQLPDGGGIGSADHHSIPPFDPLHSQHIVSRGRGGAVSLPTAHPPHAAAEGRSVHGGSGKRRRPLERPASSSSEDEHNHSKRHHRVDERAEELPQHDAFEFIEDPSPTLEPHPVLRDLNDDPHHPAAHASDASGATAGRDANSTIAPSAPSTQPPLPHRAGAAAPADVVCDANCALPTELLTRKPGCYLLCTCCHLAMPPHNTSGKAHLKGTDHRDARVRAAEGAPLPSLRLSFFADRVASMPQFLEPRTVVTPSERLSVQQGAVASRNFFEVFDLVKLYCRVCNVEVPPTQFKTHEAVPSHRQNVARSVVL